MDHKLARIYHRKFKTVADAESFLNATKLVTGRISAVDATYRVYHSTEDPTILFEIWEYPDEDSMQWVQSSMEGATTIPRALNPDTQIFTTQLYTQFESDE